MPQITQIKPQKKKGFYNLFIDGRYRLSLPDEDLVKNHLKVGQELKESDLKNLEKISLSAKAYNRVLNFLSFRPRSGKEILRYLLNKGKKNPELELVEAGVMEKLKGRGLIDDEAFTTWLIEQRTQSRNPRGRRFIRAELLSKGVSREIVERLVDQSADGAGGDNVSAFLARKDRKLGLASPFERKAKLTQALLRRGFGFEASRRLVDKYLRKR